MLEESEAVKLTEESDFIEMQAQISNEFNN